ncbi:MAG TPA: tetratricopeptide repeat protein [Chloroflexia bacterium]|nr:tetratricopeptide repeat protein [Chloroflexia bacterium]
MDPAAPAGPHLGEIPYARLPLYGRDALLAQLEAALARGESLVLFGPDGLGKTQLAAELAYRAQESGRWPGGVHWLAMDPAPGIPPPVAAPRLLIFDDLADPALLDPWRPRPGGSRVLVTSRDAAWAAPPWRPLLLPPLAPAASRALLLAPRARQRGEAEPPLPADSPAAPAVDAICELLGGVPLALALAGAYLAQAPVLPLDRYLIQLRQALRTPPRLPPPEPGAAPPAPGLLAPSAREYSQLDPGRPGDALAWTLLAEATATAIAATFALAYAQLPAAPSPARAMLHCAALCAPGPIPPALLLRVGGGAAPDAAAGPQAAAALQRLLDYHLLERQPAGMLSLHPLIAAQVRGAAAGRANDRRWSGWGARGAPAASPAAALEAGLLAELGSDPAAVPLATGRVYREHLRQVVATLGARADPATAALHAHLGQVLYAAGDLAGATAPLERALAIRLQIAGPTHPETAASFQLLGQLRHAQGDRAAAQRLLAAALAPPLPDTRPRAAVATTWDALAAVLWDSADWPGARAALEQLILVRAAWLGPAHPALADALGTLAAVHQHLGAPEAAQARYEQALAIYDQAPAGGSPAPRLASTLAALGTLYEAQGQLARARPLLERALVIQEQLQGRLQPATRRSRNQLAGVLWAAGDVQAGALLEANLAEGDGAADDLETARTCYLLGTIRQAQGDWLRARALLERALELHERLLGPQAPATAAVLAALGAVRAAQGDLGGARPLLERALASREATLGLADAATVTSLTELAALHEARGDDATAGHLLARALAAQEATLGPRHPAVAGRLLALGRLCQRRGDLAGARPLLERALAIYEQIAGTPTVDSARALLALGYLDRAQGDWEGARGRLARALATLEATLGPADPETERTRASVLGVLLAEGELATARALLEHTVVVCAQTLGPAHPATAASRRQLAEWLGSAE